MIYTSLAVIAMSASAALLPLTNFVHLHPHASKVDNRISVTLFNPSLRFRDVTINGRTYTIHSHEKLDLKARAGTIVYSANKTPTSRVGDVLVELTPKIDHQRIDVN